VYERFQNQLDEEDSPYKGAFANTARLTEPPLVAGA
jgi:hypothetical protein